MSLEESRIDYTKNTLEDTVKEENPISLFRSWLKQAEEKVELDFNAMTLCTLGEDETPCSRIVLLRDLTEEGFVFYTNYNSDKGQEISAHPRVSLNFFWRELEKQVRVRGIVEKVAPEVSDAYFASRPRSSRIGAWVSDQSSEIQNREELEKNKAHYTAKFEGEEVPRPAHWGGYVVKPLSIEFWQGRPGRLHDRIKFERKEVGEQWLAVRLSP